jgi:cytochrome oxidase Cu insertion factor (SCO1/SenC/PrrC family)
MNRLLFASVIVMLSILTAPARGQMRQTEEEFLKAAPAIGDAMPELTVYSPEGKEVKTSSLRGNYVVLTFGCLT